MGKSSDAGECRGHERLNFGRSTPITFQVFAVQSLTLQTICKESSPTVVWSSDILPVVLTFFPVMQRSWNYSGKDLICGIAMDISKSWIFLSGNVMALCGETIRETCKSIRFSWYVLLCFTAILELWLIADRYFQRVLRTRQHTRVKIPKALDTDYFWTLTGWSY